MGLLPVRSRKIDAVRHVIKIDQTRERILASSKHTLILGGPGCGKTTIALLAAHQELASLDDEQQILFLSFSRAAVRQISTRMRGIFNHETRARLEVRTFHAFFLDMVRSHSPQVTGQSARFITPDGERRLRFEYEGDWDAHTVELASEGRYVFDQLAPTAADLLEASDALRALYSDAYRLVIVDEFQDTNTDQWRVVHALSSGSTLICLADPDQRIYEFIPGVDEHRIDHLREAIAPAEFDLSADNHRSPTAGILDYANAVLEADSSAAMPEAIRTAHYRYANELDGLAHRGIAWLDRELTRTLGQASTIGVFATDNVTVAGISRQLATSTVTAKGTSVPPIDHQLHFEPELAAAAGYVVASVLEWPTVKRDVAISQSIETMIDFYRTVGGTAARQRAGVLTRGLSAYLDRTTIRSKTVQHVVNAVAEGISLEGDPIRDWQAARDRLKGTPELDNMYQRARNLRLLNATDDLALGLLDAWDGNLGYAGAVAMVRHVLAQRMLDDTSHPSRVNLMNMHRSKGKEFDGVVIVEGRYQGRLFAHAEDCKPGSARRRLLRVALTRARQQILLIRPEGSEPLTHVPERDYEPGT